MSSVIPYCFRKFFLLPNLHLSYCNTECNLFTLKKIRSEDRVRRELGIQNEAGFSESLAKVSMLTIKYRIPSSQLQR